jgi:ADP-glucose pyrophosphorylase
VITNCVIGSNAHVERDTLLDESVVLPGARIGANCSLQRAIIDSDAVIPDGTVVHPPGSSADAITLLTRESIAASTRHDLARTRHEVPRADFPAMPGTTLALHRSRDAVHASS